MSQPDRGLIDVRADGHEIPGSELLGLRCRVKDAGLGGELLECYQRGRDLIASYCQTPQRPVRVDALWRATAAAIAPGVRGVVDLVVSVHTEVLESCPELAVRSAIPSLEVLRLKHAGETQSPPTWDSASVPSAVNPAAGPGCLLFRLAHTDLSYAEMVHPVDFQRSELSRLAGTATIEVLHRLFAVRLEKGVILRARVRGVFVDRADDASRVLECYRAFASAEPPLGT